MAAALTYSDESPASRYVGEYEIEMIENTRGGGKTLCFSVWDAKTIMTAPQRIQRHIQGLRENLEFRSVSIQKKDYVLPKCAERIRFFPIGTIEKIAEIAKRRFGTNIVVCSEEEIATKVAAFKKGSETIATILHFSNPPFKHVAAVTLKKGAENVYAFAFDSIGSEPRDFFTHNGLQNELGCRNAGSHQTDAGSCSALSLDFAIQSQFHLAEAPETETASLLRKFQRDNSFPEHWVPGSQFLKVEDTGSDDALVFDVITGKPIPFGTVKKRYFSSVKRIERLALHIFCEDEKRKMVITEELASTTAWNFHTYKFGEFLEKMIRDEPAPCPSPAVTILAYSNDSFSSASTSSASASASSASASASASTADASKAVA